MKTFLITLFTFYTGYSIAQLPQTVQDLYRTAADSVAWRQFEMQNETVKQRFLQHIYNDTVSGWFCNGRYSESRDSFDVFAAYQSPFIHLVDINFDGLPDVIYTGRTCPGYEKPNVILYMTRKEVFLPFLNEPGTIVFLRKTTEKSHDLILFNYPCCSDFKSSFTYHTMTMDGVALRMKQEGLQRVIMGDLDEIDSMDCPVVGHNNVKFIVKSSEIQLLDSPFTDQELSYVSEDGYSPVTGIYHKGSEGTIWNEYLAPDGKRWYFVAMDEKQQTSKNVFSKELETQETQLILGWILADEGIAVR